jgi:RNA polymerase sigma-70 factor (ECF subfamily)
VTSSGEPDSFGEFYAREILRLLQFMRKQGASWDDAWDASQEAFTEALRRWRTIENPRAWVRTTATRAYIRQQARGQEDEERVARADWTPRPPFDKLEISEQESLILKIIASLPPRQRQVMAWHYDGYSNIEIAEILGLSADAVGASLYQARQQLKRQLADIPAPEAAAPTGGA